jgi:transcriptional/translational regulatory protein YebC/TACO1
VDFISAGIEWLPINKISLNKEKTQSVINFLETLENDEDVQQVYANIEVNNNSSEKVTTT